MAQCAEEVQYYESGQDDKALPLLEESDNQLYLVQYYWILESPKVIQIYEQMGDKDNGQRLKNGEYPK